MYIDRCTEGFVKPKKMNMIYDGQFGSTGKGLIAAKIAADNHVDIACARLSPNAGHTFYYNNKKCIVKQLPVSSILHDRCVIVIGFGSVIDVDILLREIEEYDIDPCRIAIHPRTAIVTSDNKLQEQDNSGVIKIASTQSGTGAARASKIMRNNPLAMNIDRLKPFIKDFDIQEHLEYGLHVLVETGQGFDLSLNMGYAYPYCTSNDVTPSAILADFGLHPRYMGNSMMAIRTFPIRVGNPTDDAGNELGNSGPVYQDSQELTWEALEQQQEFTTVTKRVRRVFTFSKEQYKRSLRILQPSHVFLNFVNYVREEDLQLFEFKSLRKPDVIGLGPYTHQVTRYDKDIIHNAYYKRNYL